jgi:predicted Zn-dependent protease
MSPQAPAARDRWGLVTREEARVIADRVLSLKAGDEVRVNIVSESIGNTRFADASISTSGDIGDTRVTITVTLGRRRASAATNALDAASLGRTASLAAELARLSPEDPELMPELGPQTYSTVSAFVERTADLGGETRAEAVSRAIAAATAAAKDVGGLFAAGFLQTSARAVAVATSRGLFAYHRTTDVDLSMTARTADGTGSGWARRGSRDWNTVDAAAIGRSAAMKAVTSRNPQAFEPGRHTAVLEPAAVNDLIPLLGGAIQARSADEGRSPFSNPSGGNRIGEKVVDDRVTLYSDPADPALRGAPFDAEGLPVRRITWIEKGVLRNLAYSRFWASKQGKTPTGGALLGGLALTGGTKTTDQIIGETERGILVTRFWYIRSLEPRTVLQTGLTRDGVFLIEQGKITRSLKNFRWNESPLLILNRLDEIGRAEPTEAGRLMPALRIRDFNFTSLSDAV